MQKSNSNDAHVALALLIANSVLLSGFGFAAIAPNRRTALQGHNQLIFYTALGVAASGVLFGGAMYAEATEAGAVSPVLANLSTATFFLALAWHLILWLPSLGAVDWSAPLVSYSVAAGSVGALSAIAASLVFLL